MTKQLLFLIIIFLAINSSFSQELNVIWENRYGGTGKENLFKIQPNGNQGYIMGGYTTSPSSGDVSISTSGSSDFWVVNVNSEGQLIWEKSYGMIGGETLDDIVPLADGGYIIAGGTNMITPTEMNDSQGITKFLIYRISEDGEIIWEKMLGGSGTDSLESIQIAPDGGILVGGRTNSVDGDVQSRSGNEFEYWNFDFWVVKLNINGEIEWEKSYGESDYWDGLWHILAVDDGYILGGGTARDLNGFSSSLNGQKNINIKKIDLEGNFIWEKIYGGSGNDAMTHLVQSDDGGYLIVSETDSIDGDVQSRIDKDIIASDDKDCWVVKVDNNGELLWEQYFGGFSYEIPFSASKINNGDYTIVGGTRSGQSDGLDQGHFDFWVFNIDNSGNVNWDQNIGGNGSESCTSIFQISDTEYMLAGYTNSNNSGDVQSTPNGGDDFWIVKADLTPGLATDNFVLPIFDMYPNPVSNQITIQLNNSLELERINIYNTLGQLINSYSEKVIKTIDYSEGIYYVEVITNQGKSIKKLIVE